MIDMVNTTEEQVERDENFLDELRLETEALEVGDFPKTDDMATLCKYLRHRQRLESEAERIKEQMQAMLKTLKSRLDGLDYVYMPIVAPIVSKMLASQKSKSIKTPWGTAGYRTVPDGLNITDEARLIVQADVQPELKHLIVCPPRYISKSELNQYVKKTGDLPDGVETVAAHEKFFVK